MSLENDDWPFILFVCDKAYETGGKLSDSYGWCCCSCHSCGGHVYAVVVVAAAVVVVATVVVVHVEEATLEQIRR